MQQPTVDSDFNVVWTLTLEVGGIIMGIVEQM